MRQIEAGHCINIEGVALRTIRSIAEQSMTWVNENEGCLGF